MSNFQTTSRGGLARASLIYAGFVVYGSLVPLSFRARPFADAWHAFLHTPYLHLGVASRADWIANILLYVPLAFLASGWLARRRHGALSVLLLCALIAVAVEFAQLFFPPRTVSLNDMIAELIGTGAGIALWQATGERLLERWNALLLGGREAGRAFTALYTAAYVLYALFPYDFLISARELAEKLANPNATALFMTQSCGGIIACGGKLASEVLIVAPLGVFLGMVAGRGASGVPRAFGWGLLLGAVIEGLQVFLASGVSQGASVLTRGLGTALGFAAHRSFSRDWFLRHQSSIRLAVLASLPLYVALLLALIGFFGSPLESRWVALAKLRDVRFLPFYYHYFTTETQAMHSLLIHAGAYAPIGLIVWLFADGRRPGRGALWVSGIAGFLVAAAMEALKLFLHGRKPDPTDALIAAAAAALACLVAARLSASPSTPRRHDAPAPPLGASPARRPIRSVAVLAGLGASGAALAGWLIGIQPREHYVDESALPQLPAPDTLPPAYLPRFKSTHPRLPSPTALELDLLRRYSPDYVSGVARRARGGEGDLDSVPLQELIAPGTVDLGRLYSRLMELEFSWRGHNQVKPLAVAYDWLYEEWSPSQRTFLRGKLADGCNYLVGYIRQERLSPYNVILYNSPLQALMACSIALYRDDPRGEALMAFTYDLWKNRVLPAWRQVMGRNGGWHEGGEYVGIGIGQAIYSLPAMWRAATGEDLFLVEPGIRGFPDFLVYRSRPDGTDFRWGDGAYFERDVPDARALALELGDAPYYSRKKPPEEPQPTAWPWGPLTDPTLYDPGAIKKLPLTRYFDGIGMVVARSDWSPDATYVTFKAGDNYWSHVHLDQGAFTIYKGGPLAIDSGLYGPKYGSDHHMNYAYQTIAHNTVTVTDPQDTVPAPQKDNELRPIANDGGQRRVGSGWGVEPAPLDINEWQAKAAIYRTGRIDKLIDQDGLLIAAADLTAAYTNDLSGKGTFSNRTRRVERFWRVFVYDRLDDVIVVFDDVRSTKPEFRKRWLLHSVDAPRVTPRGFSISIPAQARPGRAGGRLDGYVILPKDANINAIGGPGFEFFVDGRNYGEDGKIRQVALARGPGGPEPGAWRIEVTPRFDALADQFLVVLLPSLQQSPPRERVERLESDTEEGCVVTSGQRSLRFGLNRHDGSIRVDLSEGTRPVASHRLRLSGSLERK
jgi:VanZ family protein